MCVDAALPRNDWCDSVPVGHTKVCYSKSYKHRDLFAHLMAKDFSPTKLNSDWQE